MPFGLLTGLGAALSWGTMDVASALASRRVGSLMVTAGVVLVSAVLLVIAALVSGTPLPGQPGTLATTALLGLIGAGAYFAYFTGLRVGPISVVSGMVAAYGGLTVVLSVVLRGESLSLTQAFGATIATAGVILTGVAFEGGLRGTRFAGPGVVFAVVALVLFSMMAITTDVALDSASWLQVLLVSRLVTAGVSIIVVVAVTMASRGSRTQAHVPGDGPGRGRSVGVSWPRSSSPGSSMSSGSCRSPSGSSAHRPGWSAWPRHSVRPSRSSSPSRCSASGSSGSSGSGWPVWRSG